MATDGNVLDVPPGIFPDLATAIASFRASLGEDVESKLMKGGEEGFTDQVGGQCIHSRTYTVRVTHGHHALHLKCIASIMRPALPVF